MDRFKKIVPIIMEYFEKYISENEIMDEFQKQMAIDEMKVAAFELKDGKYFGDIPDRLKKYAPEIEKITNETILRLYHRPAIANEHYFHKAFPLYLYIYCVKSVVSNELIKDVEEIVHKFSTDYPYLVMAIDMLTDQIYNVPSLAVVGKETVGNMYNLLNPIKITRLDGKLKLYHGTSIEAYQKIIEEGHIVATNYTEIKEDAESPLGKEYTQKYCDLQTGYCFFANDLSYVLNYAVDRGGLNSLGVSKYLNKSATLADGINWKFNSGGAIFEINAHKYLDKLYYVPSNGEFLIAGDVDIKDARVILVHRKNGIISLTDEKEDKIDDLCYE